MDPFSPHVHVIPVQFGTQACRVGIQTRANFKDDRCRASAFIWPGIADIDIVPSVFLDVNDHIAAIGNTAEALILDQREGRYFENVIKSLYTLESLNGESQIQDCRRYPYNAKKILMKLMCFIRQFVVGQIEKNGFTFCKDEAKWVFAIPSVRADQSVRIFKEAWHLAHPSEKDVTIITYADAGLTYYAYLDKLEPRSLNGIDINQLPNGSLILLVAFEEELDSFNVYEKRDRLNYKQITHYISGGSTRDTVFQKFEEIFKDIFGSWVWQQLINKDEIVLDFQRYIFRKLNMKLDKNEWFSLRTPGLVRVLNEICLMHTNQTVQRMIELSEYDSDFKQIMDVIRIKTEVIRNLYNDATKKLIQSIKNVLSESDKDVEAIIIAGNMANCDIIQEKLKTQFLNLRIVSLNDEGFEVLSGAAMYGQKPIFVSGIFSEAQALIPPRVTNNE